MSWTRPEGKWSFLLLQKKAEQENSSDQTQGPCLLGVPGAFAVKTVLVHLPPQGSENMGAGTTPSWSPSLPTPGASASVHILLSTSLPFGGPAPVPPVGSLMTVR